MTSLIDKDKRKVIFLIDNCSSHTRAHDHSVIQNGGRFSEGYVALQSLHFRGISLNGVQSEKLKFARERLQSTCNVIRLQITSFENV